MTNRSEVETRTLAQLSQEHERLELWFAEIKVTDFLFDDLHWTIRYWEERMVYMNLTKDEVKNSPTWTPEALVNREYEERLYDYYGRPAYWLGSLALETSA